MDLTKNLPAQERTTWRTTLNQFLKFGIIGVLGFVVDSGFLYCGIYVLGLGRVAAALFSFPFAVSFTWAGNRFYTYRTAPHMPAAQQLMRFALICAFGLIFNRGTYTLLVTTVPLVYQYPILGLVGGTCVGMFFNFFATRKHVFGL